MLEETQGPSRRTVLAAGAAVGVAAGAAAMPAAAAAAGKNRYVWRNVEIVGGGFVPGIVFSPRERGLVYARTDIGGAYRYDHRKKRWIPLLDWVGWDKWGWTGVVSLATGPVDPDRLYLAVGTYTNDWDPGTGAILRSRDRGASWKAAELPFKLGGNMPGRGMGERLAIDPDAPATLYLGARGGYGLWRSTDHAASWSPVQNFPNPGNYADDPNDTSGYSSDNQGILWIVFDPRRWSRTIYVGVADKQNMLYRSTDAGRTWERVPGQPTGFIPHKGVVDRDGTLYLATSDTAGPYNGGSGQVWKLADGAWTDITPEPGAAWGYSGLTLDRRRPGTLMVATQISWWPDTVFFRSTDAGATWSRAWQVTAWPERQNRYEIDYGEAPWLTFNTTPAPPEQTPKLGWMTESVEIDPFDSDHLLYGTGATVYGTGNLTAWDRGETVKIDVRARGLEECAILDLISPPTGAHLLSAVGDLGGFTHDDFSRPGSMHAGPTLGSGTGIDFAERAPAVVVRVGNGNAPRFGRSTDGGHTWTPAAAEPPGVTGGGVVAVSADGARALWSPAGGQVHWTGDGGTTWTASTGVPAGATVGADRADAQVFYAYAAGRFHRSADGGATFVVTAATGLPAEGNVRFRAVPGIAGEIWFAGGSADAPAGAYGLWHSTDGGASFTRHPGIDEADTVGYGAAPRGRRYPSIFTSARIRGVRGIFRSDDRGRTWTRINDDDHQYAWTGAAITGDPRVPGRVYVATNGRGIIYGEPT